MAQVADLATRWSEQWARSGGRDFATYDGGLHGPAEEHGRSSAHDTSAIDLGAGMPQHKSSDLMWHSPGDRQRDSEAAHCGMLKGANPRTRDTCRRGRELV